MRIRRMALAAAAPVVLGAGTVAVISGFGGHTLAARLRPDVRHHEDGSHTST